MTLESDVERAQRAERLLKDPLLIEARTEVQSAIIDAWTNAPIRDKDGAHELKLMHKALNDVWAVLERVLADGKLAAKEIEERNKLSPAQFRALRR